MQLTHTTHLVKETQMRAATKHETTMHRLSQVTTEDLHRARVEAVHILYCVERELFNRTGETPYEGQLQPTWGDRVFFFTLVCVGGFMTWLSVGAWAL